MNIKFVVSQMLVIGALCICVFMLGRFYQLAQTPIRIEKEIVIQQMPSDQAMQACERMCLPSEHL